MLSGSDDSTLRIWDLEAGTCEMLLEAHNEQVVCCQWSKGQGGRRWLLSGSWDKDLKMWYLLISLEIVAFVDFSTA